MENHVKFRIIIAAILLLGVSCAPYINYQPQTAPKTAKSIEYNISVYHELDPSPPQSLKMGKLTINNAVVPSENRIQPIYKINNLKNTAHL